MRPTQRGWTCVLILMVLAHLQRQSLARMERVVADPDMAVQRDKAIGLAGNNGRYHFLPGTSCTRS